MLHPSVRAGGAHAGLVQAGAREDATKPHLRTFNSLLLPPATVSAHLTCLVRERVRRKHPHKARPHFLLEKSSWKVW
jgi:hypothetical protein